MSVGSSFTVTSPAAGESPQPGAPAAAARPSSAATRGAAPLHLLKLLFFPILRPREPLPPVKRVGGPGVAGCRPSVGVSVRCRGGAGARFEPDPAETGAAVEVALASQRRPGQCASLPVTEAVEVEA